MQYLTLSTLVAVLSASTPVATSDGPGGCALTPNPSPNAGRGESGWSLKLPLSQDWERGPGGEGAPPTAPSDPSAPQEIIIDAEHLEHDSDEERVEARGNVRVYFGQDTLAADRATADLKTGDLLAEGSVTLTRGTEVIQGERVLYNWETRAGKAVDARTTVRNVMVRARELNATPARATALDARATTCDRPKPHYRITAKRIVLFPGRRLVAYDASLWLGKSRVFALPRHEVSLQRGEASQSPFPSIGYNARDGLTLRKRLTVVDTPDFLVDMTAAIAFERGVLGGAEAIWPGWPTLFAAVTYREESPSQRIRFLEVNRLPEVGVAISSPARQRRPRRVPTQVQNVRAQRISLEGEERGLPGWEWAAQATIGYYQQRHPVSPRDELLDRDGSRFDVRALLARRSLPLGPTRLDSVGFLARASWYNTGEQFTLFGFEVGDAWQLGRHTRFALRRYAHLTDGSTPFRFDAPDLRNEWRPTVNVALGPYALGWMGRYDENRGAFFDQEFAFARRVHCLQPRFTYRTRRRELGFEIRIVGLQPELGAPGVETPDRGEETLGDPPPARRQ
jgi:lipopolysaccharide export system protein LptA